MRRRKVLLRIFRMNCFCNFINIFLNWMIYLQYNFYNCQLSWHVVPVLWIIVDYWKCTSIFLRNHAIKWFSFPSCFIIDFMDFCQSIIYNLYCIYIINDCKFDKNSRRNWSLLEWWWKMLWYQFYFCWQKRR